MNKLLLPVGILCALLASIIWMTMTQDNEGSMGRQLGGDFTLNNVRGEVSLSDFEGKVVLLFFGYTSCPDVCPTNLATMRQVFDHLPAAQKDNAVGLFVSVDPKRDSLEHIQAYSQFFHGNIQGLSSDLETLKRVAKQYGAFFKNEASDSELGYLVQHTASTFLIDTNGQLVDFIKHNESYKTVITKIQELL
jgi:protein SCO1